MKYHVFRGEHGPADTALQTRLGSISFGSKEAAYMYATSPNNESDVVQNPKIIEATITITNPVINEPDDPFIDFSRIVEVFGYDQARRLAIKFEAAIMNTGNWDENYDAKYGGVLELLRDNPEEINNLYCDAYPILDDVQVVQAMIEKGYDGAIHGGNGFTALDVEYKVFHKNQIEVLKIYDADADDETYSYNLDRKRSRA